MILMFDNNWLGGAQYYRNLIKAVNGIPNKKIEFVLFVDSTVDNDKLKEFQHLEIVRTKLLKRYSVNWLIRKLIVKLFRHDFKLSNLLKKHKVDLLTHSGWLGKGSVIPTIGWIPDFQHMHLPSFFTQEELNARNQSFVELCQNCTKIVVSSYDALKDLQKFSPESVSKTAVMQFSVPPQSQSKNLVSLDELKARYHFRDSFYLLPNQFWAHKNHKVVIKALGILKKKDISITVLATGNTNDYRQPDHFLYLKNLIEDEGVAEDFKVLGIIPHADLLALFKYAHAVINPSFFEGWSTVVEEAKSLRKTVILSGISIHKEQNPEFGIYFDPNNAEELASILSKKINTKYPTNENDNNIAEVKFTDYGLSYQTLVEQVVQSNKLPI